MEIARLIKEHIRRYKTVDGSTTGISLYFRSEKEMNEFLVQVGNILNRK